MLTKESLRQLESAAAYRMEQKQRRHRRPRESRIQEAASKLALAQQQLARTEVRADVPGIVVYRDVFFGSEQRKPQVGDQVWANQPLLILPDISKMVVETKVRETDIHKVERNQNVAVRVAGLSRTSSSPARSRWWARWPRRRRTGAAPSSSGSPCRSTSRSRGCGPA